MTKKAFITGASGFIGRHLITALQNQGWEITAFLHKNKLEKGVRCKIIEGDIEDSKLLQKSLRGTDVLFHLASALGGSVIPSQEFYRVNAQGTISVLTAACKASVDKVVHFSSAGVLGHVKENNSVNEKYHCVPVSPYDKSKLEGEKEALKFSKKGLNVVIIRPGWVYGPGDKRTFKLIRAIAKNRFILVTRGETKQTPIYIDDLIEGTLKCADKGKKGHIYHIAGSEILSVKEMTQMIAKSCNKTIPSFHLPLFPLKLTAGVFQAIFANFGREAPLTKGKLAFFRYPKPLDITKSVNELGYCPKVNFVDGMARTIKWYKFNNWI